MRDVRSRAIWATVTSLVFVALAVVIFVAGYSSSAVTAEGKIGVDVIAAIFLVIGLAIAGAGAIPTWLAYRAGDRSM